MTITSEVNRITLADRIVHPFVLVADLISLLDVNPHNERMNDSIGKRDPVYLRRNRHRDPRRLRRLVQVDYSQPC